MLLCIAVTSCGTTILPGFNPSIASFKKMRLATARKSGFGEKVVVPAGSQDKSEMVVVRILMDFQISLSLNPNFFAVR